MRKAFPHGLKGKKSVNPNPRKLPALREDVSDQALEKRQVFLLLFFTPALRPHPSPAAGQIRLKTLVGAVLYPALKEVTQRPTGGKQRG